MKLIAEDRMCDR